MKTILLLCLFSVLSRGQEIIDLGVVGKNSIILLEKCERRKDFSQFKIEVLPRNLRGDTNKIQLFTTNEFLRLSDLSGVPEGPAILGVRSYCTNGDVSPLALFSINVQREPPNRPKARVLTAITQPESEQKIDQVIDQLQNKVVTPPLPQGMIITNMPGRPIPDGTNHSYAKWQEIMEARARQGKRRSQ